MKYRHSIPLWNKNGEFLAGGTPSPVVLSSVGKKWNDMVLEQRHFPSSELADVMYKPHVIVINISHSITGEYKKEGRFPPLFKERGANSLFPRPQPFSPRLKIERRAFADILFLALNPVFSSPIA